MFEPLLPHNRVIVAVSGGVDSCVMLDLAVKYFDQDALCVVHVNHKVRPSADQDAFFVQNLCAQYGVEFRSYSIDWESSDKKTEETFRSKRWQFFEQAIQEYQAVALLLAHHKDDRIETFVYRMISGSGLWGLTSFVRLQNKCLRPLFDMKKQDILEYAKEHHLQWCEDETNTMNTFARNRLRNQVLPMLTDIRQDAPNNLFATLEMLTDLEIYLLDIVQNWLANHPMPFLCKDFLLLPHIVKCEILQYIAREKGIILSRGQMDEIFKIIERNYGGKKVMIGEGFYFQVQQGKVSLESS